jgi:hypothetical protein
VTQAHVTGALEFFVYTITPEIRDEIIFELRKVRAPAKVARNLGIDIRHVLPIADELAGQPRALRQEVHDGHGRPELRDMLVARKLAHDVWNNDDPAIAGARAAYEAGSHDMATGRDGQWLLLYSIPQRKPTPRPDYFQPEI